MIKRKLFPRSQSPLHTPLCYSFLLSILRRFLPLGVHYALRLFHALYESFKAFLCLPVNVSKVSVQPAACEKIGVCNLAVLLQIVQFLKNRLCHCLLPPNKIFTPLCCVCCLKHNFEFSPYLSLMFQNFFCF